MSKKFRNFCSDGYFELKMCRKVYKYVNLMHFFFFFFWLTGFRLLADRVIFEIGQVVDKVCI